MAFRPRQRYRSYIAGFIYSKQLGITYLNSVTKARRVCGFNAVLWEGG